MLGDPEFFDIETLKMVGLWPMHDLPAHGIVPYIKRLGNDLVGIELGVLKAESSCVLLEECPNIRNLFCIDPFLPFETKTAEEMDAFNKIAVKNLSKYKNVSLMTANSLDAHTCFDNESIDFVFIDTLLDREHLEKEMDLYYPKIKKNGMIFGHDANHVEIVMGLKSFRDKNKIRLPILHSKNQIWYWVKR